jgi:hypothetical protein
MGILWIVAFCMLIFFAQDIVAMAVRIIGRSGAKTAVFSIFVTLSVCLVGFMVWSEIAMANRIMLCLLVIGGVCLMTTGILSLLFVATIPEDMEKEEEDGR